MNHEGEEDIIIMRDVFNGVVILKQERAKSTPDVQVLCPLCGKPYTWHYHVCNKQLKIKGRT